MKFKTLPIIAIAACTFAAGSLVAQPVNNDCAGAIDLQSGIGNPFGVVTSFGPYDNTTATVAPTDPIVGFECFGEPTGNGANPTIENTLWYSFVGDGGKYFIETGDGPGITNYIDDGDTQIAIYTGSCGSLVPYACNEDGPSSGAGGNPPYPAGLAFNTTIGVTYYIMVDGFNFSGALSAGEFYLFVNQQVTVACSDPTVTLGTASANKTFVCPGDSVRFDITGVVTPTVGAVSGLGWFISNASITGDPNPTQNPAVIAGYTVQNPAPATSFRQLTNDGTLIGTAQTPYGTYYWTPTIFGNGTVAVPPGTFMTQIAFDPTCTFTGTSLAVDVLPPGSPICAVGLSDIRDNGFGILNVHPVPVTSELNFNLRTVDNGEVNFLITDISGRQVMSKNIQGVAGEKSVALDVTELAAGMYHLSATSGTNNAVVRFVKH